MFATITYYLNTKGRKASLLSGGDGDIQQRLKVERDHPRFAEIVERGWTHHDNSVSLDLSWNLEYFDAPQTVESILDWFASEAAKRTINVLANRRTRSQMVALHMNREGRIQAYGGCFQEVYLEQYPHWPYRPFCADQSVIQDREAQAWVAELETANAAAKQAALERLEAKRQAQLAKDAEQERQAQEREAAINRRKVELGGEETDLLLDVEAEALASLPSDCWEPHQRGKQWMATITVDPNEPDGLKRRHFHEKTKGRCYYIIVNLGVGDAVEFGADYYLGSGHKCLTRWYGFVVGRADDALILRPCQTGTEACNAAENWLAEHPKGPNVAESLSPDPRPDGATPRR
ncbi:MAG TPA: hypothetical protein VH592_18275 [Gemmataceae bacterium]|jgi:hypothetical protein